MEKCERVDGAGEGEGEGEEEKEEDDDEDEEEEEEEKAGPGQTVILNPELVKAKMAEMKRKQANK